MLRNKVRAFTLIEVMIVIAIIAILFGILVPNYRRARAEAMLEACKKTELAISEAVLMGLVRHPELNPHHKKKNGSGYLGFIINEDCLLVEAGFLKTVPRCPCYKNTNNPDGLYSVWFASTAPGFFYIRHDFENAHKGLGLDIASPRYAPGVGFYSAGTVSLPN